MKCRNCGEEYNEDLFPVCPFCLTENKKSDLEETERKAPSDSVEIGAFQSVENDIIESYDETTDCSESSIPVKDETENRDDVSVPNRIDKKLEIRIEDIDLFSRRIKNLLQRNGIFTIEQLKEAIESSGLNKINGLGKQAEREIEEIFLHIQNSEFNEAVDPGMLRIADVFAENKYNLFVKYCADHSMEYMVDLDGFPFDELASVQGIGKGKIVEIVRLYEKYDSGEMDSDDCDVERTPIQIERLFTFINSELVDLEISLLVGLGLSPRTVNSLYTSGSRKIGDLQNISKRHLESIVGKRNIEKFVEIEDDLKRGLFDLFGHVLTLYSEDDDFQLDIKKANGYTLQQLGDESGVTRERVRQKIVKFNNRITPYMDAVIDLLIHPKNYITVQELLDIYDNDDFDKVLLYWCLSSDSLEYLDFADVFVPAKSDKGSTEKRILEIAEEFVGEGINVYDYLEDLDILMESNGYPYVDGCAFLNLVQKHGYKVYRDYVVKGKKSYGYLCAKIVARDFPNGIKLYDSTDLNRLRELVLAEYGDIGVSDDDRAFSTRLADYLILSGRGTVTAEANIHVEMSVLEEIKDYIDNAAEGELSYAELFSRFEGMLRMMSNIDNYNFLHGVLKLYYSDEYDFSNRDYLKKKGNGFKSGRLSDKIKEFIVEKGCPVSRNEIKQHVLGLTDIVLNSALMYDGTLIQWDYNYYYSLDLLSISQEDKEFLVNSIEDIMATTNGYCSDNLLYEATIKGDINFIATNKIVNSNNLYYICQKLLSQQYDFRRPHIVRKGMFEEISVKNVALHLLGYPDVLSYRDYQVIADKLMWPSPTVGIVFAEIEKDFVRVLRTP